MRKKRQILRMTRILGKLYSLRQIAKHLRLVPANIRVILNICLFFFFSFVANTFAAGINSLTIAQRTAQHYMDYTHFKVIGACLWWKCHGYYCKVYPTLELDEYLPDLVVSVYNKTGDDPWQEANILLDKVSYKIGSAVIRQATGFNLANGNTNTLNVGNHYDSIRTKSVDVIGNPFALFHFPFVSLKLDTKPFLPYFQSDLDALGSRSGSAEVLRPETWNPVGHYIGKSFINHWSYEFPRSMTVNVENDYKASAIAALHAADIVTNQNMLHVVQSTSDSCGKNCAVSNVIEELNEKHAIWQEVYPLDRHIHIGEDDTGNAHSLGSEDEQKGNGNYVFVVWRHYRGCVQGNHFIAATVPVPKTKKR